MDRDLADGASLFATLQNPFPAGMNLPSGNSQGPMTFVGLAAGNVVRENRNPTYQSWNFSVQRQMPADSIVEVNYTGSKGTHLLVQDINLSKLDPVYWTMGRPALNKKVPNPFHGVITNPISTLSQPTIELHRLLRPFPQYLGADRGGSEPGKGNSSYHAVQFKYEKRFSHGLNLLAHYTISKMIDTASHGGSSFNWLGGRTRIQDYYNLANERSVSAHDIPQRFVTSFNYQLPIGRGRALGRDWGGLTNAVLGGWEFSGVATLQSGVPIQVYQNGGQLWDADQRPHLIGDPNPGGSVMERFNKGQYFNPAAFLRVGSDQYGSAPRNLNYRAPGLRNIDIALMKSFAVKEGIRGEFRAEMEHATNTVMFAPPGNTAFGASAFGVISGYAPGMGPRQVQLGAKFYF